MSQYPSPYQQPPYPPSPYSQPPIGYSSYGAPGYGFDPLAPARRVAILQGILGSLMLVCGLLLGAMPYLVDIGEAMQKAGMQPPAELPPGWTFEEAVRIALIAFGGCGFVFGLALLALSFFVRGGSRGAIITSIILVVLVLMFLAVRLLGGLVQLASNPVAGIVDLLFAAVLLALFALNLMWLVAAAKSSSSAAMMQQQYLAQFYQMQQQQHAYAQPGYAYPPPPPPQAPAKAGDADAPPPSA